MNASEIRQRYLNFYEKQGHAVIPRARLVPDNDPTTLFTGSGMQPLVPYLLGEEHPAGNRLTDSQVVFRSQDIEEVGDNRHDTMFEMLGNWSLGDYFKEEQLPWIFEFFTKEIGLDPNKLYVTCFLGDKDNNIPRDTESAEIWKKLFKDEGIDAIEVDLGSEAEAAAKGTKPGERILYYDASKNWWCRNGKIADMPVGEPGGPSTEVFYEFDFVEHNKDYGEFCHANCDCGRFVEIGNNVLMEYQRAEAGFEKLPKKNIDYGGGLERVAMAAINNPDVYYISLLWPVIEKIQELSSKKYEVHTYSMRVIADHLRAAVFLINDGVMPSNKEQGYVLRRLMRRAIRRGLELGIEQDLANQVVQIIVDMYSDFYPELIKNTKQIQEAMVHEEKTFRHTLSRGLREFKKLTDREGKLTGKTIFMLSDTYGFPAELSIDDAAENDIEIDKNWQKDYDAELTAQRERSRSATKGQFKGGLADHSEITTKYHTATHMMYRALRTVLGDHVEQRGSNITAERLRFDFNNPEKVTREQLDEVEKIVNDAIKEDIPVAWRELPLADAMDLGARGHFGEKYGEVVKMYTIGHEDHPYSRELCGGPHVEHTGALGEGGKTFKILKEESSSAGIRRIKAALV